MVSVCVFSLLDVMQGKWQAGSWQEHEPSFFRFRFCFKPGPSQGWRWWGLGGLSVTRRPVPSLVAEAGEGVPERVQVRSRLC